MTNILLLICSLLLSISVTHAHTAVLVASQTNKPKLKIHKVKVSFDFIYHDFFGKIKIYDVKDSSQFDISETRNVTQKSALPTLRNNHGKFEMRPGESRTFVLVVENNTDQNWYFNSTPHSISPIEASVGQRFECLCNHSIFTVEKKSFWYRIVRFELENDFSAPSIHLTHNILGVKSADAKDKYNEMLYDK